MSTLEAAREALAKEWERSNPVDEASVAAFYRESQCLADDLEAWHQTEERQQWTRTIVEYAKSRDVQSVLDVGAGAGHDLRAIRDVKPRISAWAVEPNRRLLTLDNYPVGGKTCTSIEDTSGVFEMVLCIDVLEHVPNPDTLLAQIVERVKPGGLLITSTATHDHGTPLHLPELEGWTEVPQLEAAGFARVARQDRLFVWERRAVMAPPATVYVVAHREISAPTVECLFELVGNGWPVGISHGDADVGRHRSKVASSWYREQDTNVFLMIDDDIVFSVEDVEKVVALAYEKRSIAIGNYPVADGGHMAGRGWAGQAIHYAPDAEPVEIRWPSGGFLAAHRDVVEAVIEDLPLCYAANPDAFWPMFQEYPYEDPDLTHYLSEDYAFGQRARDKGFGVWLEPSVNLTHLKVNPLNLNNMAGALREKPE